MILLVEHRELSNSMVVSFITLLDNCDHCDFFFSVKIKLVSLTHTSCYYVSYPLRNTFLQNLAPKDNKHSLSHRISEGQEFKRSSAMWFWFRAFCDVVAKAAVRIAVNGASIGGRQACVQVVPPMTVDRRSQFLARWTSP